MVLYNDKCQKLQNTETQNFLQQEETDGSKYQSSRVGQIKYFSKPISCHTYKESSSLLKEA